MADRNSRVDPLDANAAGARHSGEFVTPSTEMPDPQLREKPLTDDEKLAFDSDNEFRKGSSLEDGDDSARAAAELGATEDDVREAREYASRMTMDRTSKLLTQVMDVHKGDPNFPHATKLKIQNFLSMPEEEWADSKNEKLVEEMKIETALITINSPYAEVRAVVPSGDDPSLPVSTIRMWTLGVFFCGLLTAVNTLFSIRKPAIGLSALVCQLLAYPLGKAWEKWLPALPMKLPFVKEPILLNPGRFNKKEHMLIMMMATVASSASSANTVVDLFWIQELPFYFNQKWAKGFGYQIVNLIATNFMGFGLAGVLRKFLVYPAFCVWPLLLVYFALMTALHDSEELPVLGPLKRIYTITRFKLFMIAGIAMFLYFWFPDYIFTGLSLFAWMTWIAPKNHNLNVLTGMQNGLGLLNPIPSFDWNIIAFNADPLIVPSFTIFNIAFGMWVSGFAVLALYYTNTWNMAYIPINTNIIVDHFGLPYNVSLAVNEKLEWSKEAYMNYSAAYISAGQAVHFFGYFAMYSAAVTHVALYHRKELVLGFKGLWNEIRHPKQSARKRTDANSDDEYMDVHMRLMSVYPEVSELWYFLILAASIGIGAAGIACWPTDTSPAVPLFGVAICLIFMVPVGLITAVSGFEIPLTVIAQFIGGLVADGNAMVLNYFKVYGYVVASHAIGFANLLKAAHYAKIPPWVSFITLLIAAFIGTFVTAGIMQFQMTIENVCTTLAPNRFTCPAVGTMFSAAVSWGTIGPIRLFGAGGQYTWLLAGFPVGVLVTVAVHLLRLGFPRSSFLTHVQPVLLFAGNMSWAPYSFSYVSGGLAFAWLSWNFVRKRYLAFWAKYNYTLAAALQCGIALSAIVIMFSVQWEETMFPNWWGNNVTTRGCEGAVVCTLKQLLPGERFLPWWHGAPAPGAPGNPYPAIYNLTTANAPSA